MKREVVFLIVSETQMLEEASFSKRSIHKPATASDLTNGKSASLKDGTSSYYHAYIDFFSILDKNK